MKKIKIVNSNICKKLFAGVTSILFAGFWRTHKTHLINNRHVKDPHTSRKPYVVLNNGEEVVISRRRVSFLRNSGCTLALPLILSFCQQHITFKTLTLKK